MRTASGSPSGPLQQAVHTVAQVNIDRAAALPEYACAVRLAAMCVAGSIVFPEIALCLGDARPLHFPAFGVAAAEHLSEQERRQLVGMDGIKLAQKSARFAVRFAARCKEIAQKRGAFTLKYAAEYQRTTAERI